MRPKVIQIHRLTREEQRIGQLLYPETNYWRPVQRKDCLDGIRPCPYVACRHHLFLDVDPRSGSIRLNYPDKQVWDLDESCALDLAHDGKELTLEEVGEIIGVTRERIRQIENIALKRMKNNGTDLRDDDD